MIYFHCVLLRDKRRDEYLIKFYRFLKGVLE